MKKIIVIILVLMLSGCFNDEIISIDSLDKNLNNSDSVFIDVKEKDEIKEYGTIKNFVNFPYFSYLKEKIENNDFDDFDKNKKIYVICKSGSRASLVVKELIENGFEAYNLGGILDYDGENIVYK